MHPPSSSHLKRALPSLFPGNASLPDVAGSLSGRLYHNRHPGVNFAPLARTATSANRYGLGGPSSEDVRPSQTGTSNASQSTMSATVRGPMPLICWRSSLARKAISLPVSSRTASRWATIARARVAPMPGRRIKLPTGAVLGLILSQTQAVVASPCPATARCRHTPAITERQDKTTSPIDWSDRRFVPSLAVGLSGAMVRPRRHGRRRRAYRLNIDTWSRLSVPNASFGSNWSVRRPLLAIASAGLSARLP